MNSGHLEEFRVLLFVTVEDVDIDFPMNTLHPAIRTQLPEGQTDIGFVFTIVSNPDKIVLFDIRCVVQVSVDEDLIDIQYRSSARMLLHNPQPCPDMTEQNFCSTHFPDLAWVRFYVEYWRKVTLLKF